MTITFRPACSISTFISTMKVILVIVMIKESTSGNSLLFHKYSTKVVRTKYGPLRGVMIHIHPPVEAFLGVPYATPPVGSLRYMPPVTPSIWRNTRLADRFGAVCPQSLPDISNRSEALLEYPKSRLFHLEKLLPLLTNQSEDCLYLNLYVPRTDHFDLLLKLEYQQSYTSVNKYRPITEEGLYYANQLFQNVDWAFVNNKQMSVDNPFSIFTNLVFPEKLKSVSNRKVSKINWFTDNLRAEREFLKLLHEIDNATNKETHEIKTLIKEKTQAYHRNLSSAKKLANEKYINESDNTQKSMWHILKNNDKKNNKLSKFSPEELNKYFRGINITLAL